VEHDLVSYADYVACLSSIPLMWLCGEGSMRYRFCAIAESVSEQTMPIDLRCCRFDEFGMVEAEFGHELPFA
jgi:hypothetical protein